MEHCCSPSLRMTRHSHVLNNKHSSSLRAGPMINVSPKLHPLPGLICCCSKWNSFSYWTHRQADLKLGKARSQLLLFFFFYFSEVWKKGVQPSLLIMLVYLNSSVQLTFPHTTWLPVVTIFWESFDLLKYFAMNEICSAQNWTIRG